jgi:site-specific DNA-methyltransferase (adenine-specific)
LDYFLFIIGINYAIAKQINGGKQMKNLWEINAERHKTKHPTEKPETLM